MTGPCEWPVSYVGCGGMPDILSSMPASGVEAFESMATEYLWRWTQQTFGLCTVTIRPCRQDCGMFESTFYGFSGPLLPLGSTAPFLPVLLNGQWMNLGCGRCGDRCSCSQVHEVVLPGPIYEIVDVVIDGQLLMPTAYRVDNRASLVRIDGQAWPLCNDMSSDSGLGTGAAGTWEVTYKRGAEVPTGGQVAAGILAVEFAKAACEDASCRLPKRVQTVTRQGVTIGMLDTFDDIDVGHTGIWLVDSWVASTSKTARGSRVYSPDVRPLRRTT